MLEFLLNNKPFILRTDTSVRMIFENPACQFDKWMGDAGIGIEIPVNEHNRMLLSHPDRFEKHGYKNITEFEKFEIRYSGYLLMEGTFIIQNANSESYSGWLRSSIGNLKREYREKYVFDSISFYQNKIFSNKADYDPDHDDYGCPTVYNQDFFRGKGESMQLIKKVTNPNYNPYITTETKGVVTEQEYIDQGVEVEDLSAAFFRTAGWRINDKNEDGTIKTPWEATTASSRAISSLLSVNVVSPMLFLNFVLKTIFKDAGYFLDYSFLAEHPDLKRLVIYNNYDITRITYGTQTLTWLDFNWNYGDATLFQKAVGKEVDFIRREVEGPFIYKNLLPQISLDNFILGVNNLLNVFPFFKSRNRIDIIDRESILTSPPIDIDEFMVGNWTIGEKENNTLKFSFTHDSDDIMFQEGWTNIDDYRESEKEPIDTWDDLKNIENPEIGELRYIRAENKYAQYRLIINETEDSSANNLQKKYLGWQEITRGFQNGFFNTRQETEINIKTSFSTLSGEQFPITGQKGNIQSEMFNYESFSPRLLFYLGNNNAKYETENISLDWEKINTGLLTKRWPLWLRFWSKKQPVSRKADLPINVLDYLRRNIYKKFRTIEGSFIIKSIEIEFGVSRIFPATIHGYKNNYHPKTYKLNDMIKASDRIYPDETFII